jgi:16S rRNA (uracil1498-N3)-methyltransferase
MSRHRFYAPPASLTGSTIILSPAESHHLAKVLRLKAGDEVFVFDGCGHEYRCRVLQPAAKAAQLEIAAAMTNRVEPPIRVTLAQSLAKGDKFDLIVQKATELGVAAIVPVVTARSELKLGAEQAGKRLQRWERVSLEALKQSGRRTLVDIHQPVLLRDFLDKTFWRPDRLTQSGDARNTPFVFCEKGGKPLREVLDASVGRSSATAVIGPEGGWSEDELGLFAARECKLVTLGPRILRTETAAIAALAVLFHSLGDF